MNTGSNFSRTLVLATCILASANAIGERSAGETLDDSTLTTKVKYHLMEDESAPAGRINVEVYKGTVMLSGFVESMGSKQAALAAAREMKDTNKVIDSMIVMPGKRGFGENLDDAAIHAKVDAQLLGEQGLIESQKISVQVRKGEVLLGGFVSGSKIKEQAGKIASSVSGVKKVHNRIVVAN